MSLKTLVILLFFLDLTLEIIVNQPSVWKSNGFYEAGIESCRVTSDLLQGGHNNLCEGYSIKLDIIKKPVQNGTYVLARILLSSIDRTKDPCDNFFEYACGNWKKINRIPSDMFEYSNMHKIYEQVNQQTRSLLESNVESRSNAITFAKQLYRACMDTGSRSKSKSKPIIEAIQSVGGWPLLQQNVANNNVNNVNFTDLLGRLRRDYGLDVFVKLFISNDYYSGDNDDMMLSITQTIVDSSSLTTRFYSTHKFSTVQANPNQQFLLDNARLIASDMGLVITDDVIINDVNRVLNFQKQLVNLVLQDDGPTTDDSSFNKIPLESLNYLFPLINWRTYFQIIMPPDVFKIINASNFRVNVPEQNLLVKMQTLLNHMDKKTIINYIIWQLVEFLSPNLDVRYDDVRQKYAKTQYGRTVKPETWKYCVEDVTGLMGIAVGAVYVRNYFTEIQKYETSIMLDNIEKAFRRIILNSDWMDMTTKQFALEKIDAVINQIGYPDYILNNTALDDYYKNLTANDRNNYFALKNAITVWSQNKYLYELTKPFNRRQFVGSPIDVNAYYSHERNAIVLPAAILQPPVFKSDFPKAFNYGAVGAIMGHEITHGFDYLGRQFDKSGHIKNWWSPTAAENFIRKMRCIVLEYGSFTIPELGGKVNGMSTSNENIADNGGIKASFTAYKTFVRNSWNDEPALPGLQNFTNEQIFFLSYANLWCDNVTPEYAEIKLAEDEHSPNIYRVIGTLSNFDEFSKAFNCPSGSRMNPDLRRNYKCSVW